MTHFKYALCYCLVKKNSYDSLCPTFAIQIAHFKVENIESFSPSSISIKAFAIDIYRKSFFCEELLVVNASIVIRMK